MGEWFDASKIPVGAVGWVFLGIVVVVFAAGFFLGAVLL